MQIADDGSLSAFCERDFAGSKFESAVVGWAAHRRHLLNSVSGQHSAFVSAHEATIVKWHWEALFFLNELVTATGRMFLAFGHVGILSDCFRILLKRTAEIRQDARLWLTRLALTRSKLAPDAN